LTTIVAVRKDNKVCIGADSLVTVGDNTAMRSSYSNDFSKIINIHENYIGMSGSCAHAEAIKDIARRNLFGENLVLNGVDTDKRVLTLKTRSDVFKFSLYLHYILNDEYCLNTKPVDDDVYNPSHFSFLIANKYGIFGVYHYREVDELTNFWAIGSGAKFALGAMYSEDDSIAGMSEDSVVTAGRVARAGLLSAIEFDSSTAGPIELISLDLVSDSSDSDDD